MLTIDSNLSTIPAVCSHFGICGGCIFQTQAYQSQLLQKETYVKTLFDGLPGQWFPIIPCLSPWNYRNKMEFSFSMSRKGERFLGLMMRQGRGKVTNLTECHIAPLWMSEVLREVRAWWNASQVLAYHPPSDLGTLRTLTLREGVRTGQRMAILTISGRKECAFQEKDQLGFQEAVKNCGVIDAIVLRKQIVKKGVPTHFEETVLDGRDHIYEILQGLQDKKFRFKIRPSSFFQPNTAQAENLYKRALELAQLDSEEILLDLYCGTGTIGILASPLAKKVIGIELNSDAVKDARDNIATNHIINMEVFEQDAGRQLPFPLHPSTIIVDPPRVGLSPEALGTILAFMPKKILYISCNPESQAINIREFLKEGYEPYAFQPVDQFPHTRHIENIVALVRHF